MAGCEGACVIQSLVGVRMDESGPERCARREGTCVCMCGRPQRCQVGYLGCVCGWVSG